MSNAQVFHDPLREDLDYLIDRSRQHDRELKELRGNEEGRRQLEYLQGRAQQHEDKVGRLSEDVSVLAGQPRPWVVRLGNMLYRAGAGLAAILLAGGIWLFTDVIADANADGSAWLLPTILIAVGVVTALTASALRYLLAGE